MISVVFDRLQIEIAAAIFLLHGIGGKDESKGPIPLLVFPNIISYYLKRKVANSAILTTEMTVSAKKSVITPENIYDNTNRPVFRLGPARSAYLFGCGLIHPY
jgi:hypothetical protein